MTIFYPTELTQRFQAGLVTNPAGAPDAVPPDRGRTFVRGGGAADPMALDAVQTFARTWELARFNRFWREEVKFGAYPFWIRDQQFDGQTLLMPDLEEITMPDGVVPVEHAAWWYCQFIGRPSQPSVKGGLYQIMFPLEVIA